MRVLSVSANTEHINMPVFPIGLASADAAEAVEGWLQETVQQGAEPAQLARLVSISWRLIVCSTMISPVEAGSGESAMPATEGGIQCATSHLGKQVLKSRR